jgi:hypothetical protein
LKDLLALKQQHVSIVEAREAVKQSQKNEETLMQGRAIMMFTIVTIILVSCDKFFITVLYFQVMIPYPIGYTKQI